MKLNFSQLVSMHVMNCFVKLFLYVSICHKLSGYHKNALLSLTKGVYCRGYGLDGKNYTMLSISSSVCMKKQSVTTHIYHCNYQELEIDDDNGLELSLGLSLGGSSGKAKARDAPLEPKAEPQVEESSSKTIFNIFMELSYMVPFLLSHIFASKSTPICILICSLSANITIAFSVSPLFHKQRNNTQVIKKSRSPNAKFCFCTIFLT